jgi:hypothetical protein
MRKITRDIVNAFNRGEAKKIGNTRTDGQSIWLFGNKIAEKINGVVWITNAGWQSPTTRERLNGLHGVTITQRRGNWYLNGVLWDGSWTAANVRYSLPEIEAAPMVEEVEFNLSCRWNINHDAPIYSVFYSLSKENSSDVAKLLSDNNVPCREVETDTASVYKPNYFVVVLPSDVERAAAILSEAYPSVIK